MAFQFIPNADGSFDEGMRQTNSETGVEYIYTDGAWRPLGPKIEDQFDELDERYLKREGSEEFTGDLRFMPPADGISRIRVMKTNTPNQLNITSHPYTGGALSDAKNHITIKNVKDANGDDVPETKIYFVTTPTKDHHAANKAYVDQKSSSAGGVPVGSIMMWVNAIAPDGWFKLKGGTFDITEYPLLHSYLEISVGSGYTSGKLPDWRGHYPAQLGDHLNGDVGIKLPQRTAAPSGGFPHSSSNFNNGEDKTANKAGGGDFAGIRKGQVSINSGWDSVTRPKTVAVHFIIKHD